MTVQKITHGSRYIGFAADDKPVTTSDETIVVGSEFVELDTGKRYCWDGSRWNTPQIDYAMLERLDAIVAELKSLKEFHMAFAARL